MTERDYECIACGIGIDVIGDGPPDDIEALQLCDRCFFDRVREAKTPQALARLFPESCYLARRVDTTWGQVRDAIDQGTAR